MATGGALGGVASVSAPITSVRVGIAIGMLIEPPAGASRGISGTGIGCANAVLQTKVAVTTTPHLVERRPCMAPP
jgi:hypothetical protein